MSQAPLPHAAPDFTPVKLVLPRDRFLNPINGRQMQLAATAGQPSNNDATGAVGGSSVGDNSSFFGSMVKSPPQHLLNQQGPLYDTSTVNVLPKAEPNQGLAYYSTSDASAAASVSEGGYLTSAGLTSRRAPTNSGGGATPSGAGLVSATSPANIHSSLVSPTNNNNNNNYSNQMSLGSPSPLGTYAYAPVLPLPQNGRGKPVFGQTTIPSYFVSDQLYVTPPPRTVTERRLWRLAREEGATDGGKSFLALLDSIRPHVGSASTNQMATNTASSRNTSPHNFSQHRGPRSPSTATAPQSQMNSSYSSFTDGTLVPVNSGTQRMPPAASQGVLVKGELIHAGVIDYIVSEHCTRWSINTIRTILRWPLWSFNYCGPVLSAVKARSQMMVKLLLEEPRIDPNTGCPLYHCVLQGDVSMMDELLKNPRISPNRGSPLFHAIVHNNSLMVRLLVDHPKTMLNKITAGHSMTPLIASIRHNSMDCFNLLINHHRVDVNRGFCWTPLQVAVMCGRTDCVNMLLNRPLIEPNATIHRAPTKLPVELACENNDADVLKVLLSDPRVHVPPTFIDQLEEENNLHILQILSSHGPQEMNRIGFIWSVRYVLDCIIVALLLTMGIIDIRRAQFGIAGSRSSDPSPLGAFVLFVLHGLSAAVVTAVLYMNRSPAVMPFSLCGPVGCCFFVDPDDDAPSSATPSEIRHHNSSTSANAPGGATVTSNPPANNDAHSIIVQRPIEGLQQRGANSSNSQFNSNNSNMTTVVMGATPSCNAPPPSLAVTHSSSGMVIDTGAMKPLAVGDDGNGAVALSVEMVERKGPANSAPPRNNVHANPLADEGDLLSASGGLIVIGSSLPAAAHVPHVLLSPNHHTKMANGTTQRRPHTYTHLLPPTAPRPPPPSLTQPQLSGSSEPTSTTSNLLNQTQTLPFGGIQLGQIYGGGAAGIASDRFAPTNTAGVNSAAGAPVVTVNSTSPASPIPLSAATNASHTAIVNMNATQQPSSSSHSNRMAANTHPHYGATISGDTARWLTNWPRVTLETNGKPVRGGVLTAPTLARIIVGVILFIPMGELWCLSILISLALQNAPDIFVREVHHRLLSKMIVARMVLCHTPLLIIEALAAFKFGGRSLLVDGPDVPPSNPQKLGAINLAAFIIIIILSVLVWATHRFRASDSNKVPHKGPGRVDIRNGRGTVRIPTRVTPRRGTLSGPNVNLIGSFARGRDFGFQPL